MTWGSPVERERKRRINLALWAYAYEFQNDSLVDDATFDAESLKVDLTIDTGNAKLDAFFKEHFKPDTGMWITKHPELDRIAMLYKFKKSNPPEDPIAAALAAIAP